jgi:hypothetical protein
MATIFTLDDVPKCAKSIPFVFLFQQKVDKICLFSWQNSPFLSRKSLFLFLIYHRINTIKAFFYKEKPLFLCCKSTAFRVQMHSF